MHSKEYDAVWVNVCSLANIDYLIMAKKYGIPKRVIHSHNSQNMDSYLRGCLHTTNRHIIKNYATDFWACSKDSAHWFYNDSILKSSHFHLINNAIHPSFFEFNPAIRQASRKALGITNNTLVIGHVGRFHFQKNHDYLLRVFKGIHTKVPDSVLILVGVGERLEEIKALVKSAELENSVIFLGQQQNVSKMYQAMDLFLFPSKFEGMSVALLEAEANGLPCLISTGNPQSAVINDNVERLQLTEGEDAWIKKAIKLSRHRVSADNNKIHGSPYDIKFEAGLIQSLFDK
jgi:glycosyltransferase involved in cell wall biosynthesis